MRKTRETVDIEKRKKEKRQTSKMERGNKSNTDKENKRVRKK